MFCDIFSVHACLGNESSAMWYKSYIFEKEFRSESVVCIRLIKKKRWLETVQSNKGV